MNRNQGMNAGGCGHGFEVGKRERVCVSCGGLPENSSRNQWAIAARSTVASSAGESIVVWVWRRCARDERSRSALSSQVSEFMASNETGPGLRSSVQMNTYGKLFISGHTVTRASAREGHSSITRLPLGQHTRASSGASRESSERKPYAAPSSL